MTYTFLDAVKESGAPLRPDGQIDIKQMGQKHDPSVNPAGPWGHGAGGLFSRAGDDRRMFSTIMLPDAGLLDALPVMFDPLRGAFSGYDAQLNTIITGVTAGNADSVSNQPTAACAPGPQGGFMKICTLVTPYGRYSASFTIDLREVGRLRDLADDPNKIIMNLADPQTNMMPTINGNIFRLVANEFTRRMYQTAVSFKRMLVERVWVGNPVNSAGSNNWKDLMGLELIVNAGNKVDAQTASVCRAADSDIKNFGYGMVHTDIQRLHDHLDMLYYYSLWNARKQRLGTPTYAWVMRPELFDEIAKVWPVAQITEALAAMAGFASGTINLTGNEVLAMRNAMREQQFLAVRGRMIPVILDDTIPESDSTNNANLNPGEYASDIYLIPMTVLGGFPVTYIEPYDQSSQIMNEVIRQSNNATHTWTSDGGQFRWYLSAQRNCLEYNFETEFRLKMHCTQLAGRLTNVGYSPLQHVRSWKPSSGYFFDGGNTSFNDPKYYTTWSPSTPVSMQHGSRP